MTSRNKNVKYTLSYQVDQKSINQVEQSTSQLEQAADRTAQSFGVLGNSAQKAGQQLRSAFKDSGTGLLGKLRNEARDATKDTDKLRQSIANVNRERANTPSGGAAPQTNFGQLKGGIGAVGQLGQVAGFDVGAITGAAEALADVADNAAPLKANLSSLVTAAMSPLGLAAGAATVALGGVLFAASKYNDMLQNVKKNTEELVEAELERARATADIQQLLLQGDTEGAFKKLIAQEDARNNLFLQRIQLEQDLQAAEERRMKAQEESGFFVSPELRQARSDSEGLQKALEDLDMQLVDATSTLEASAEALGLTSTDIGVLAAATAPYRVEVEKTTDATNAATTALLARAAAEGEFVRFQAQARQNTADQNKDLLASINTNKQALETEIATLRQSGDTSEQTTQRIAALEAQLGELGRQAEFVTNTALPAAEAEERRNKALEDSKKALEETTEAENKANEERAKAAKDYADALVSIAKQSAQEAERALKQSQQRLAELGLSEQRQAEDEIIQTQRESLEAQIAIQRQTAEQEQAHVERLQDIRKQSARDEKKLASERNFAALFDLRQRTNEQLQDANEARQKEIESQNTALAQQAQDRQRAEQYELEDRQRAQQRAREDIQRAYQQQLADIQESERQKLAEIKSSQAAQVQQTKDALNEQTTLRKAALAEEYRLTQETEAAKLEVFQQALNTVVGMKGLQTGGYGGTPLPMGGSLNPNGYGVQTPLPMTNTTNNSNSQAIDIKIISNNTDKVAQTIKQVLGV